MIIVQFPDTQVQPNYSVYVYRIWIYSSAFVT